MRHMVGPDAPGQPALGRPRRSLSTAYLIWFLLGIFGAHRFYLGDGRGGRRYLIALATGVALPVLGLAIALLAGDTAGVVIGLLGWIAGLVIVLGVLAMAIVDAFRLPALTRRANAGVAALGGGRDVDGEASASPVGRPPA
jgi:TM2 domain-containing membrane protein YozV